MTTLCGRHGINDYDVRKVALTDSEAKALADCFTAMRQGGVAPFLTLVERFGHDMAHEIARRALILTERARSTQPA